VGAVVYVDRFGNLISNIGAELLDGTGTVRVGNPNVGAVRTTFGDVRSGELVAYRGSGGTLEVAVRDGSAAEVLQAGLGTEIRVTTS
jgi:S-adenosylmethionine hydrolase